MEIDLDNKMTPNQTNQAFFYAQFPNKGKRLPN